MYSSGLFIVCHMAQLIDREPKSLYFAKQVSLDAVIVEWVFSYGFIPFIINCRAPWVDLSKFVRIVNLIEILFSMLSFKFPKNLMNNLIFSLNSSTV